MWDVRIGACRNEEDASVASGGVFEPSHHGQSDEYKDCVEDDQRTAYVVLIRKPRGAKHDDPGEGICVISQLSDVIGNTHSRENSHGGATRHCDVPTSKPMPFLSIKGRKNASAYVIVVQQQKMRPNPCSEGRYSSVEFWAKSNFLVAYPEFEIQSRLEESFEGERLSSHVRAIRVDPRQDELHFGLVYRMKMYNQSMSY